jgi:hypothetical protein
MRFVPVVTCDDQQQPAARTDERLTMRVEVGGAVLSSNAELTSARCERCFARCWARLDFVAIGVADLDRIQAG